MLGGLKRIQKGQEFYTWHKLGIYAAQIAFIMLVVFFCFTGDRLS